MITMGLLSLNKGAVYGYRYDESSARCTVEQRQLVGQKPPLKLKEI